MLTIACLARQIHGGPVRLGTRCGTLDCQPALARCLDCRCLLETHAEHCFHRPNRTTVSVPDQYLDPYCVICTHRRHDAEHTERTMRQQQRRSTTTIPAGMLLHMDDHYATSWASIDALRATVRETAQHDSIASDLVIPPSIWVRWVTAPLLGSNPGSTVGDRPSPASRDDRSNDHINDIWEDR
jgi:hypothetical protein